MSTKRRSAFLYRYGSTSRLTNRWTPAKGNTAYRYDAVGNLTNIDHSVGTGSTPSVSLAYDAFSRRLTTMVDAIGTTTYGYNAADQLLSEDGPWTSDTVSYTYNNRLRASMSVSAPNASAWTQSYGYDAARRLTSTASPAGSFGYTYDPVRNLQVGLLTLPNGAFVTNTFDEVARLLTTVLKNSAGAVLNSHAYAYDLASQRSRQTRTDGSYLDYTYDSTSQLLTALGKEPGGTTSRLHEQFGYAYDPAANLNYRTNNALVEAFGVNSLNELTAASRSGALTVAGTTTSSATNVVVYASGQPPEQSGTILYGDNTFATTNAFSLSDGTNMFTAIAQDAYGRRDTNTSTCYLPSSVSFAYDANVNGSDQRLAGSQANKRRPAIPPHFVHRRLEVTSRQQHNQHTLLGWLRVEYAIEKPSNELLAVADLDSDTGWAWAWLHEWLRESAPLPLPLSSEAEERGMETLIGREEYPRSIEPARALAAETLKLERRRRDLASRACGLTRAEPELNALQAALRNSSWPGNPSAAAVLIWK